MAIPQSLWPQSAQGCNKILRLILVDDGGLNASHCRYHRLQRGREGGPGMEERRPAHVWMPVRKPEGLVGPVIFEEIPWSPGDHHQGRFRSPKDAGPSMEFQAQASD